MDAVHVISGVPVVSWTSSRSHGRRAVGSMSDQRVAASQIGWALLLPFGRANVAYWTRELPAAGRHGIKPLSPRVAAGAGTVRLFWLGLTVYMTVTLCSVSLDLVATQCSPESRGCAGGVPVARCTVERLMRRLGLRGARRGKT